MCFIFTYDIQQSKIAKKVDDKLQCLINTEKQKYDKQKENLHPHQ